MVKPRLCAYCKTDPPRDGYASCEACAYKHQAHERLKSARERLARKNRRSTR